VRAQERGLPAPAGGQLGLGSQTPGVSPFIDYFEWRGTHDPAAYLSVPAAIDFQAHHDWPRVRAELESMPLNYAMICEHCDVLVTSAVQLKPPSMIED